MPLPRANRKRIGFGLIVERVAGEYIAGVDLSGDLGQQAVARQPRGLL